MQKILSCVSFQVQIIIMAEDQQNSSTENLWENKPFLLDLFFAFFHYFLLLDTCHVGLTWPGIKPLALEAHSLNHQISREVHLWGLEWARIIGKWCKKGYSPGTNSFLPSSIPRWLSSKESACQCRRCESDPWARKIPGNRKWQPTPVLLPGKFHG